MVSKGYTKNWSKEIVMIDSVLKTSTWKYGIKDLDWETIIESFYKKELLLSKLQMSYYPQLDSHIRGKVKKVLDF